MLAMPSAMQRIMHSTPVLREQRCQFSLQAFGMVCWEMSSSSSSSSPLVSSGLCCSRFLSWDASKD